MWSILALGAIERLIHHVINLDAITRIQLNELQGKMLAPRGRLYLGTEPVTGVSVNCCCNDFC
jgi:hypothetical protein